MVLFRLATANTQSTVLYVKIFAISGAIIATGPWIIQLLVSTTDLGFIQCKYL
ncbi:hypothetical protein Pint_32226 [Pistacia integerrima]|uniref:Uncharacterized protein n=1 Tax=Pistacia integerrima TaxID=434235 RepID=A0ACC0XNH4_9ROSI|nr:hypothetical protein Pint_32226 [Pistacia integerrima]